MWIFCLICIHFRKTSNIDYPIARDHTSKFVTFGTFEVVQFGLWSLVILYVRWLLSAIKMCYLFWLLRLMLRLTLRLTLRVTLRLRCNLLAAWAHVFPRGHVQYIKRKMCLGLSVLANSIPWGLGTSPLILKNFWLPSIGNYNELSSFRSARANYLWSSRWNLSVTWIACSKVISRSGLRNVCMNIHECAVKQSFRDESKKKRSTCFGSKIYICGGVVWNRQTLTVFIRQTSMFHAPLKLRTCFK